MAAIPAASGTALARLITPSKPQRETLNDAELTSSYSYSKPKPHAPTMTTFVHNPRLGKTGHYKFLYSSEEFVAHLLSQGPSITPSALSILPDGMSTGHLTRGALSTIPPDLQHQNTGAGSRPQDLSYVTPYTAGVQSLAPSPALQPPSTGTGDGSSATPSNNPDTHLQDHNSVVPHTAGTQPTASIFTSQQPSIGNGNGYSVPPNNYPTSFADPHYQRPMPPPASTTNARSMQSRGASPAPGLDASGPSSSNARNSSNRRPAFSPHPQPCAIQSNDRASAGLTNHPLAPAPAPAPSASQQEETVRRGSAPASDHNNAAAAMNRGTNGLKILAPAPTTTDPVGARAPSPPATPQAQSGAGSAGGSLQAAQLRAAAAFIGPNGHPRLAPSQAQAPTISAGAGDSSTSATSQAQSATTSAPATVDTLSSLATSQAQTRTGHARRPGGSGRPSASRPRSSTGSGADGLQTSRSEFAAMVKRGTAVLEDWARKKSAGTGKSPGPATSQAQSMAASARPPGGYILSPFQQASAPTRSAGDGDSSQPATSQSQSTTTPAPRAGTPSSRAPQQTRTQTGSIRPGVPRRRAAMRPIFSAGGGQDELQAPRSNNAAGANRRSRAGLRGILQAEAARNGSAGAGSFSHAATSQAQPTAASAESGSSSNTAIVNDAMSTPATGGGSAPTLPVNQQTISTTAPAGLVPTIPVNSQSAVTPATGGDGGGASSPPVTNTPQDQSLVASTVSVNTQPVSTPATGGGGNWSYLIVPPIEFTPDSGNDGVSSPTATSQAQSMAASAGADVPSLPANPQAASVSAGASSFSVASQRAPTNGAGSDNSGGPPRKKRKLDEKQSKDSPGRTKK